MKKTLLSLAFLLTGVGAWAQETFVIPEVGGFYKIKGVGDVPYLGTSNVSETDVRLSVVANSEDAGIYYLEEATGGYYLKCVNPTTEHIYVCKTGNDPCLNSVTKHVVGVETTGTTNQFYIKVNGNNYIHNNNSTDGGIHTGQKTATTYNQWGFIQAEAPAGFYNTQLEELVESVDLNNYPSGEVAGYYSETLVSNLQDAVNAANTAIQGNATKEDITALQNAIDAMEINQPDPSKYYTITSNSSQSACTGRKIYVNNSGTMQFEDATSLANVFQFKAAPTDGQYYIYCVDRDTYVNSNKAHGEGTFVTATGKESEAKPVVIASQLAGKVSITPVGGAMLHAQANGATVVSYNANGANTGSAWILTEVSLEDVAHNVAIGTTGWASLYLPFNATKPAGATLYMVTEKTEDKATLTELSGDVLPAGVAVLVKADPFSTLEFKYTTEDGDVHGIGFNMLSGSALDEDVAEEAYVLALQNEVVGFYKATLNQENNTAFKNNAFKAYLPAEGAAGARFLNFDFGTETGIECIEGVEATQNAVVYDLAGRRVQNAQKGLYIVNGKKVVK